ncbi:unnamed protein product [Mytilus coruscus]|uniref:Reverse transcriptase domain-containing protein n=1 Tax=Mytilus coruscus TaxID=42192 RepID=A0A6J8ES91_MYTCO|nr:unnamed protein product [Mytilus coruscus]
MIQVVYEDVNVQYVVDRYRNLLNVIPVEWKNTVNTDIHRISIPRTIDISIICKNVHYDLKLCSTKTLYTIMLENIVEEPVGIELWKSEFNVSSEAFSKIWEHVNMYWKPSNLVELDFKVLYNCIFTNVKLQKIGLVDDNICKVCCSEKEDILHIFMNCDKLEDFHNYLSSLLVRIFENCDSNKISLVRSEELLILGLRWHMKVYATEGILDLQYKFYKELYSCVDTDNDKMSELLDSVDTKIDDNDCNFCDADISHEEIYQEKAFDRVSHKYLLYMLRKYGFGDRFVKWIEIFYYGINSAVKCNGFLTNYFHIKNGIRQGCPISALLYVLAAEPLHCRIVKNDKIKGIKVPNCDKEGLIYQHADDTTLSLCNKESIPEVFKEFDLYSKATGAKINKQKSEILCVGYGELSDVETEQFGLQVCKDAIQLLGVYVGPNKSLCDDMNWKNKIKKVRSLLNMWLQRQLTLQGRVTVVNTLMLSRFWHTLFVTSMPEWAYVEIKRLCVNFIWDNRSHLVKYSSIVDEKCKGWLQLSDIKCKMYAFRLKYIGRLIDDQYHVLWKDIFKYFVSKIYGMQLGLEILYTTIPNCELKCIPMVYQEMCQAL